MKDKLKLWKRLVPGCRVRGCEYDNSLKWADPRPEPTEEEMMAEALKLEAEISSENKKRNAEKRLKDRIKFGVIHNEEIYACDTDTILLLNVIYNSKEFTKGAQNTKHIIVKDIHNKKKKLTKNQFQDLFEKINDYYYTIIKDYWNDIGE